MKLTQHTTLIVNASKGLLSNFSLIVITLSLALSCKKQISASGPGPITPPPVTPSPYSLTPKPEKLTAHCWGFYEYLPEGYLTDAANTKYPLLISFHGGGEIGENSSDLAKLLRNGPLRLISEGTFPKSFTVNNQSHKFIILAPQFVSSGNTYPNEIDAIIEYAKKQYRVDASRIYLTGLSFGGGLCWNYAGSNINYARKIAAMVPIASYIRDDRDEFKVDATRAQNIASSNLPIWSTHNSGDNTCPLAWVVNAHNLLINSNPAPDPLPRLTVFTANSHGGWSQTYQPTFKENGMNVYEWMLQFRR